MSSTIRTEKRCKFRKQKIVAKTTVTNGCSDDGGTKNADNGIRSLPFIRQIGGNELHVR